MTVCRGVTLTAKRFIAQAASALARPKRFYREVSVVEEGEGERPESPNYGILLDERKLKTPAGKEFAVRSRALATAIAHEWDGQRDCINRAMMHLSALAFTSIDNPLGETTESITSRILDYLYTDTLLYFANEPERLVSLQHERWAPIIRRMNSLHGMDLRATQYVTDTPVVPTESHTSLKSWLGGHGLPSLIGLQYGVDAVKSVLLTLATYADQVGVEEAVKLARLEQIYQTSVWGNVDSSHTVEHEETSARLAAGILFSRLSSNNAIP